MYYHAFKKPWATLKKWSYKFQRPIKKLEFEALDRTSFALFIIAFNNVELIEYQIREFQMLIEDEYVLNVIDNSTDATISDCIYRVCNENRINYLKLPFQTSFRLSASHALAINYVIKNVIRVSQPKLFGFIDHDLFPVKRVKLAELLKVQPFYGLKHYAINKKTKTIWDANTPEHRYLWAGFCFFSFERLERVKLDFQPVIIEGSMFDTGGANFLTLFKDLDASGYSFPSHRKVFINEKREVEIISEEWVHISNGSDWRNLGEDLNIQEVLNNARKSLH